MLSVRLLNDTKKPDQVSDKQCNTPFLNSTLMMGAAILDWELRVIEVSGDVAWFLVTYRRSWTWGVRVPRCDETHPNGRRLCAQISYCCVLRAVGRSAGTQPNQKMRIRQLVGSTILIFLVCFSPYHVFLLVRTLLERDCSFITGTLRAKRFRWFTERQRERENVVVGTTLSVILLFQEYSTTTTCRCCWPPSTAWPIPLSTVSWARALATASSQLCGNPLPGYSAAAVAGATPSRATLSPTPKKWPPRRTTGMWLWCCSATAAQWRACGRTLLGNTVWSSRRLRRELSYLWLYSRGPKAQLCESHRRGNKTDEEGRRTDGWVKNAQQTHPPTRASCQSGCVYTVTSNNIGPKHFSCIQSQNMEPMIG